jgi:hypothetical protein
VCVCFDRSQPNCPFLTKISQERAIWSGAGKLVVNGPLGFKKPRARDEFLSQRAAERAKHREFDFLRRQHTVLGMRP